MKKTLIITLGAVVLVLAGYFAYQFIERSAETKISVPEEQEEIIIYAGEIYTFATADKKFTVQYNNDGSWAKISFEGNEYELPSAVSASGARYANKDESIVFWEHQREALLEINGVTIFEDAKLVENENDAMVSSVFSLEETKWLWKETEYANGQIVKPNEPEAFVLYFMEEGRFSSQTDCNNVMGTFNVKDGNLTFGQMAATKMACPDKETQEEAYAVMLADVYIVKVSDSKDRLELEFEGGKGTMTFSRLEE